jgi:hypothetical protein
MDPATVKNAVGELKTLLDDLNDRQGKDYLALASSVRASISGLGLVVRIDEALEEADRRGLEMPSLRDMRDFFLHAFVGGTSDWTKEDQDKLAAMMGNVNAVLRVTEIKLGGRPL